MSNSQIQVMFDRKDRAYELNEEVCGKVVLNANEKLNCRRIWIVYGWRTHGRGNPDTGGETTLNILSEATQINGGEHREFPFRFIAPEGPATYHGHIVNVDWYVTAHVEIPMRLIQKNGKDFLLVAHPAPEETRPRERASSMEELNGASQTETVEAPTGRDKRRGKLVRGSALSLIGFFGCGWVWLFYVLINTIPALSSSISRWIFGIFFFGVPAGAYVLVAYGLPFIKKTSWKRNVEIRDLRITPDILHTGDQVTCRLQLQTRRPVYLESISATLSAEEVAVEWDSGKLTYSEIAYKKPFVKIYRENLLEGRPVFFECVLPVSSGAPATFRSKNNEIKWYVKIVMLGRRSSWEKTLPITVLP